MESSNNSSSPKYLKPSPHTALHSTVRGVGRCIQPQQSFRLHSEATQKFSMKEQTKPLEIMLHTQLRATKRAGFNHMVATKMYLLEQQKQIEERVQKIIEEEEARMLRKEMIPRAQLMPFFDRSFPQRSTRPLTVPKEPSSHILNSKCWSCLPSNEHDSFKILRSKL